MLMFCPSVLRESCSESEDDQLSWMHKQELRDSLVDMYKGESELWDVGGELK